MARVDRAQEMRAARELFEFAMREGLKMEAARERLAAERWQAADARLAERRCGTAAAPNAEADTGEQRQLPWYQKGPYA